MDEATIKSWMTRMLDLAVSKKAENGKDWVLPRCFSFGHWHPEKEDKVLMSLPIILDDWPESAILEVIKAASKRVNADFVFMISEAYAATVRTEELELVERLGLRPRDMPGRKDILLISMKTSAGRYYTAARDVDTSTGRVGEEIEWSGFSDSPGGELRSGKEGERGTARMRYLDMAVLRKLD